LQITPVQRKAGTAGACRNDVLGTSRDVLEGPDVRRRALGAGNAAVVSGPETHVPSVDGEGHGRRVAVRSVHDDRTRAARRPPGGVADGADRPSHPGSQSVRSGRQRAARPKRARPKRARPWAALGSGVVRSSSTRATEIISGTPRGQQDLARIIHRLVCRTPLRVPSPPSHAPASSRDHQSASGGRRAI
jgi:hypothetical protein